VIKTVHVTNHWHAFSGGVRAWYRSVLDAANAEGRPVRLIVPGPRSWTEEVGAFGRIHHVRAAARAPGDGRYRLLLPHRYILPRGPIRRILEDERPDLIEICDKLTLNWLAGFIRRRWLGPVGRPVLVGLTCERLDDTIGAYLTSWEGARRLAAAYCRWCYVPLFDAHLAVSEYVACELRTAMHPRHRRPITVASPGVDFSRFTPDRRSRSLRESYLRHGGGRDEDVLMLYAGRLSPEKNVGLLLKVVDRLNSPGSPRAYRLLLAGSGPLAGRLRDEAAARPAGQIRLLGHVESPVELAVLYANCDVFLHPNPREPFGIAPLEAMASGCPVVVPAAGGVLSYANPANAWLADPSPDGFARAVETVVADPETRRGRVILARETALRNGQIEAASRVFRLYDSFHRTFAREQATPAVQAAQRPAPG